MSSFLVYLIMNNDTLWLVMYVILGKGSSSLNYSYSFLAGFQSSFTVSVHILYENSYVTIIIENVQRVFKYIEQ